MWRAVIVLWLLAVPAAADTWHVRVADAADLDVPGDDAAAVFGDGIVAKVDAVVTVCGRRCRVATRIEAGTIATLSVAPNGKAAVVLRDDGPAHLVVMRARRRPLIRALPGQQVGRAELRWLANGRLVVISAGHTGYGFADVVTARGRRQIHVEGWSPEVAADGRWLSWQPDGAPRRRRVAL